MLMATSKRFQAFEKRRLSQLLELSTGPLSSRHFRKLKWLLSLDRQLPAGYFREAMTSGQLQALLPSALDAAPGAESFKKGAITVVDLVTQIEKTAPEVGLAY